MAFSGLKNKRVNSRLLKKTDEGYSVTGKKFDFTAPTFGDKDEPQNDLMKYAPYVIGGILLLSMKR